MTTTSASPFGLALYGFGLGLALVANIAGYITHDRVFLWMGVVGLVMDMIAQRQERRRQC